MPIFHILFLIALGCVLLASISISPNPGWRPVVAADVNGLCPLSCPIPVSVTVEP